MYRKLITATICGLFILLLLNSHISANIIFQNESDFNQFDNKIIRNEEDPDRWAVIIGITNYSNGSYLVGCADNAKKLRDVLIDKNEKWNENNIRLLLDGSATRQGILDSLDWLTDNADDGDKILFYFDGHGSHFNDTDGDEPDGMDEAIIPYDFEYKEFPYGGINYITDDELDEKFDNISKKDVEGMFLIFSCCISGGLVDWRANRTLFKSPYSTEMMDTLETPDKYIGELSKDVNDDNRVILTSTTPQAVGLIVPALFLSKKFYISFGEGICKAIERGKTSAEDISHFAKRWWLSKPRVYLWTILVNAMFISIFFKIYKVILFPMPMIKDDYPSEHPLSAKLSII